MRRHWAGEQMLLVSLIGFTIQPAAFTSLEGAEDN